MATAAYVALHLVISLGDGQATDSDRSEVAAAALWLGLLAVVLVGPVLWLRHRRRSGARELVGLVSRFVPAQPRWRKAVRAANSLGLVLFGGGAYTVDLSERRGHTMSLERQFLLLAGGLAAVGAGLLILRRTRLHAARPAARALLLDGRRPVLYLRSFDDDGIAAEIDDGADFNLHSREEQLARALGAIGPVIAVGRPGEPLPHLGAARFYLPLDDWKSTVLRLMDLSQLIVLRLGQGDGLWWEVEQARATQPAAKLLLLAPAGPSDVVARLNGYLPVPVPPDGLGGGEHWISAVIVFDDRWTPRVTPVGLTSTGWWRGLGSNAAVGALETPTVSVARALRTALASVGRRRRTMIWRARFATQLAAATGFGMAVTVALAGWLGYRAVQVTGLW
ncbi:hypothetical protein [Streptomyces sp. NRRL S-350]|uniref:hypothetical protein n=1 Tax=Streptomyces sp. NRRL S-350 TaxID=1463902 RepID=UPI00068FA6C8